MYKELTIRGNKAIKIVEYFETLASQEISGRINHAKGDGNYRITGKNWLVEVSDEVEIYVGKMIFPEVLVKINIADDAYESFVYKFRIEFLSAGG